MGTVCFQYIRESRIFRDSSLGNQSDIEMAVTTFIDSLEKKSAPKPCIDFVIEMLCHHAFGYCYPNDTNAVASHATRLPSGLSHCEG